FSSRRRHTRFSRDWSSDVCSSDLPTPCLRALKLVLAQLLDEGRTPQAEQARGARDRAFGLLERPADQLLLDRAEVLLEVDRAGRSEERRVGRECSAGWAAVRDTES